MQVTKSDRLRYILGVLEKDQSVEISQIARQLDVSSVTVRNDLRELQAAGKLRRTHGGAIHSSETPSDLSPVEAIMKPKLIPNLALKEKLAEAVVRLIEPGDSIFLGGGSTFYVIARHLRQRKDLRIVTSSMSIAYELAPFSNSIFFIGGELAEFDGIYNTGGPKVAQELEKIYVNKAFIGVSGIDLNAQLTVYDLSQFTLLTSTKKIARETILVADATKFGFQSAHRLGSVLDVADVILTNREVDARFLEVLHSINIPTILA